MCATPDQSDYNDAAVDVQWPEDSAGHGEDSVLSFIAIADMNNLERCLADPAMCPGRAIDGHDTATLGTWIVEGVDAAAPKFEGVWIDTCANKSSVMRETQYMAYCGDFKIAKDMRQCKGITIRGIGRKQHATITGRIQIRFTFLPIISTVDVLIIKERVPWLLSMRDMIHNGLEISIQNARVYRGDKSKQLQFEDGF